MPLLSRRGATATSLIALGLVGGALLSVGCKRNFEGTVEDRIDAALPKYLGPADHYETHVDAASSGAILRGRVRSVEVTGVNVHLRPELLVDRMVLTVHAVEVDTHKGTLQSIGDAEFTGTISSDNLKRYVDSRNLGVRDLSVSIEGDRMHVKARPEVEGILPVPVSVRGVVSPTPEGDHLDFLPDRGSITVIPVPGVVLSYLSHKLNPVISLTGLPIPIHVLSASMADGKLTMSGTVDTAAILNAAH